MSTEINRRVQALEWQNRVLITLFAAAGCFMLLATAAAPPSATRASSYLLTDQDGRVRAELGMRNGTVGLFLIDEHGSDRLSATYDGDTTGMFINDDAGTTRIGVAQFGHGGGGFALHGPDSKGAAVLYLKGEGSLRFFDSDGAVIQQVLGRTSDHNNGSP